MAAIFMFIPGMHERYLYAVIIFSIMTFIYSKDRRFLYLFLGFSISVFVNVYHILDVFIVQDIAKASYPDYPIDPLKEPVLFINSLANCFLFLYLIKVGVDVYIRKKLVVDTGVAYTTPLEVSKEEIIQATMHLSRKAREKSESPIRMGILFTGLLSVLVPVIGIVPWIIGRKEMKNYPKDKVLCAGNLLGRGIVILWIVIIAAALLYLPIHFSGLIKL